MSPLIVTGIGTDVGKTVVSAILLEALQYAYWKPIQSGSPKDTDVIRALVPKCLIHPPAYQLSAPLSPHHAARLENISIDMKRFSLPNGDLIVETAGGLFVPFNDQYLALDFFASLSKRWIVVSRHYLGSINHTLLTLEALKFRGIRPLIVFNGTPNPDTEKAILSFSGCEVLGRVDPHRLITPQIVRRYACQWKQHGIPLPKC